MPMSPPAIQRAVRAKQRTMPEQDAFPLEPTIEEIRARAYEIFCARGRVPGDPDADWRQAEHELRSRLKLLGHR